MRATHLLIVAERLGVDLFHQQLGRKHGLLVSNFRVLLVRRQRADFRLGGASVDLDLDAVQILAPAPYSTKGKRLTHLLRRWPSISAR